MMLRVVKWMIVDLFNDICEWIKKHTGWGWCKENPPPPKPEDVDPNDDPERDPSLKEGGGN